MKKRILSVLLAVLMVFSLLPVTAFAASKITLKSGETASTNIYAGNSYNLKVSGYSSNVKWSSSNKSIASIGSSDGKLKALAPGKVTITAKDSKSGKSVASKSFSVLRRANSISCDTELYLNNVGDTATLRYTLSPSSSTDAVSFATSDSSVATVGSSSGKVTAKGNGECFIRVYAKATSGTANSSVNNKYTDVRVYVGPVLDCVKQTALNELEATFKADIANVTASDFKVTDGTGAEVAVTAAEVSKSDGKTVVLTLGRQLNDGRDYTVTSGGFSAQFTASESALSSLAFEPTDITVDVPTVVKVVGYDENGVKVEEGTLSNLPDGMTFTIAFANAEDGTVNGDEVTFHKVGATATAEATYGSISKTATLTAMNAAIAADGIDYTIAASAPDFDSQEYRPALSVKAGESGKGVYFRIKDTSGRTLNAVEYAKLTFSSNDSDTMTVSDKLDTASGNKLGIEAKKAGAANIIVKNGSGTIVATLPVTVSAAPKINSLNLEPSEVTVSNSGEGSSAAVSVTAKDQYGDAFDALITAEKGNSGDPDLVTVQRTGVGTATLTINGTDAAPGQYTCNISADGEQTKSLTIHVGATVHVVTFNLNGHGSAIDSQNVSHGSTIAAPTAPTASGWTFSGWYKESGCTNAWNFASDTVTATTTLYAKWTQNKYTVTFDANGNGIAPTALTNITHDSTITVPDAPTAEGWTFDGWYKEAECTNVWNFESDTVSAATTLYAKWTQNKYTVTFDANGNGIAPTALTNITHGSIITAPDAPTAEGWTFGGWYKEAGCTNVWNFESDTVTAATTLYAKWTQNKYTVTFDANGNGIAPTALTNITHGSIITAPDAPTAEGWTFGGWYKGSGLTQAWDFANDTVTADITLYAKWTQSTHTVNYNLNGHGNPLIMPSTVAHGGKLTPLPTLSEDGWDFGGWYKDSGLSQAWDIANDTVTADTTLYAKWTQQSGLFAGSGTQESPYALSTLADLAKLADYVNGTGVFNGTPNTCERLYFKLAANIGTVSSPVVTMIGDSDHHFKGHFDGNGHTVTLNIQLKDTESVGLFSFIENATVSNVVTAGSVQGKGKVGALCGNAILSDITNCDNYAGVSAVNGDKGGVCGSIVGDAGKQIYCSIINCRNYGTVSGPGTSGGILGFQEKWVKLLNCRNYGGVSGGGNSGGICGAAGFNTFLTNCYNSASVKISANEQGGGGILGTAMGSPVIENCYSSGLVSGGRDLGGVMGFVQHSYHTITESYYDSDTSGCTSSYATGMTSSECKSTSSSVLLDKLTTHRNGNTEWNEWVTGIISGYPVFAADNANKSVCAADLWALMDPEKIYTSGNDGSITVKAATNADRSKVFSLTKNEETTEILLAECSGAADADNDSTYTVYLANMEEALVINLSTD